MDSQFADQLEKLKTLQAVQTYEDMHTFKEQLYVVLDLIEATPTLLSDQVLDTLEQFSMNSPYRDINNPGPTIHHHQTPEQDVCLHCARAFSFLACHVPEKSGEVVKVLEKIAHDSLDYDVRVEAIQSIWLLSLQTEPHKSFAVSALVRQGDKNSNAPIRMRARDNLLDTCTTHKDVMPRAISAQMRGTRDTDIWARQRAISLLTNRVKSPLCPDKEIRSLLSVFETAATDSNSDDQSIRRAKQARLARVIPGLRAAAKTHGRLTLTCHSNRPIPKTDAAVRAAVYGRLDHKTLADRRITILGWLQRVNHRRQSLRPDPRVQPFFENIRQLFKRPRRDFLPVFCLKLLIVDIGRLHI
ncbi:MAG: hypothetical protein HY052_02685 [Proteobacteria bacterium]|nr:hypothetical protein [Pseudomonadota bacterium]